MKYTNLINKLFFVLFLLMNIMLYQNFDYGTLFKIKVDPIDHEVRESHAKELLGKFYRGSFASQASDIQSFQVAIYNTIYERLPQEYKKRSAAIARTIVQESERYNFDPVFLLAVIETESKFNPKIVGTFGEIGLMQIRPCTAEWFAAKSGIKWNGKKTLENPVMNIKLGAAYLAYLSDKFYCNPTNYIAAYNMGAANVRKLNSKRIMPKEYSLKVMSNYKELYTEMVAMSLSTHIAGN